MHRGEWGLCINLVTEGKIKMKPMKHIEKVTMDWDTREEEEYEKL